MATGVPTIIVNSTGHQDIVGDGAHCLALQHRPLFLFGNLDQGWAEASVDEAVQALEHAYSHRQEAQVGPPRRAGSALANWGTAALVPHSNGAGSQAALARPAPPRQRHRPPLAAPP